MKQVFDAHEVVDDDLSHVSKKCVSAVGCVKPSGDGARGHCKRDGRSPPPHKKSRSMYYGEHGVVVFVGEGGEAIGLSNPMATPQQVNPEPCRDTSLIRK